MPEEDPELAWLKEYLPPSDAPPLHKARAEQVKELLESLIGSGRLPVTIGLFGGWGSGKTTLLSVLSGGIKSTHPGWKVVYFNAWKYADVLDLVPAIIYKILKHGNHGKKNAVDAIKEIALSLGRDFSSKLGKWSEKEVGIDLSEIVPEVIKAYHDVRDGIASVSIADIDAYYTQIDRSQDLLARVFSDPKRVTVVMIDELDRCDPDEAYQAIRQLRVLFAMRNTPIAFILGANPEPIGLAIKHKYGLSDENGAFESRSILEKFVDVYVDMAEPTELAEFVDWIWKNRGKSATHQSLIMDLDAKFVKSDATVTANVTALQSMQTDNPLYSNLRLLRKTLERACMRERDGDDGFLWTSWHLEIADKIEPRFRREIKIASSELAEIACEAHRKLLSSPVTWHSGRLDPTENANGTLFALYKGMFWDDCKTRFQELKKNPDPESAEKSRILSDWMSNFLNMDFVILMTMLPSRLGNDVVQGLVKAKNLKVLCDGIDDTADQLGYLLATY
jgi:hypothetical protein